MVLAGMDGNQTHPGRLISAPQTVLKTAGLRSTDVRQRPQQFSRMRRQSMNVRIHPPLSAALVVFLAVSDPS